MKKEALLTEEKTLDPDWSKLNELGHRTAKGEPIGNRQSAIGKGSRIAVGWITGGGTNWQ
jgi:hypothetical protein